MKTSLFALLAVAGLSSFSVSAADFVDSFKACAAQKDSLKRLLCYDNLAKVVNYDNQAPIELPAAPVVTTAPKAAAKASQPVVEQAPRKSLNNKDVFGAESKVRQEEKKLDQVSYSIKELSKTVRGKWRFTFENGQVWEQKDEDSNAIFKVGETVVIKRGVFDAFYLKKPNQNRNIRVKRIK